jgi:hypothetical protein
MVSVQLIAGRAAILTEILSWIFSLPLGKLLDSDSEAAFPLVQLRSLRHASTQEDGQTIRRKHAPAVGKSHTHVSPDLRAGDMRYLASTPCAPILRMPLLLHTVTPTHATNAWVTLHA